MYVIVATLKVLMLIKVELYAKDKPSKAIAKTLNLNNIVNLKALIL